MSEIALTAITPTVVRVAPIESGRQSIDWNDTPTGNPRRRSSVEVPATAALRVVSSAARPSAASSCHASQLQKRWVAFLFIAIIAVCAAGIVAGVLLSRSGDSAENSGPPVVIVVQSDSNKDAWLSVAIADFLQQSPAISIGQRISVQLVSTSSVFDASLRPHLYSPGALANILRRLVRSGSHLPFWSGFACTLRSKHAVGTGGRRGIQRSTGVCAAIRTASKLVAHPAFHMDAADFVGFPAVRGNHAHSHRVRCIACAALPRRASLL